jgi:cytochrome oxidase Cu insertion factor (SCO1/SenC/PrrC family)
MKASTHCNKISILFLTASLLIATPALTTTQLVSGKDTDVVTASHPWIGESAPDFELPSTRGNSVKLSTFKGQKFVVIHFAASW